MNDIAEPDPDRPSRYCHYPSLTPPAATETDSAGEATGRLLRRGIRSFCLPARG